MADSGKKDKNEGMIDKAKGKVKETIGDAKNDDTKKREGQKDQNKGGFKDKKGDVKGRLK
ncbi:MAG: CsbD family protein [Rubrobacter sp.]|jgi:uncharacterized protein YjbJ (UPF0337 family)|nr:CsbD family protein [Rubrobacter sp.]